MHKEETDKDDDIDNNMIIPNGLDKPRSQIEVSLCIISADILFMKKTTNFEKFTKNFNYFKRSYLLLNTEEQQLDNTKRLEGEEESIENQLESENVFIRITFAGITVRNKWKIEFLRILYL
jgi:hypothetical protein